MTREKRVSICLLILALAELAIVVVGIVVAHNGNPTLGSVVTSFGILGFVGLLILSEYVVYVPSPKRASLKLQQLQAERYYAELDRHIMGCPVCFRAWLQSWNGLETPQCGHKLENPWPFQYVPRPVK